MDLLNISLSCSFIILGNKYVIINWRALREKCPNTEFFLTRIFPYLDWMQENTGQKKLYLGTIFARWCMMGWVKLRSSLFLFLFLVWGKSSMIIFWVFKTSFFFQCMDRSIFLSNFIDIIVVVFLVVDLIQLNFISSNFYLYQ